MNPIIGIWKAAKMLQFSDDTPVMKTKEEIIRDFIPTEDESEPDLEVFDILFEFTEDGKLNSLMKLPEDASPEEIAKAVEEGEIALHENPEYMIVESKAWEDRDGVPFIDTGIQGEMLGEVMDSFAAIEIDENGCFTFMGMVQYEKVTE